MKPRLVATLVAAALALGSSGCANLSGLGGSADYGCKAPVGVRCESVSGTYYNAIQNNLPSQRRDRKDPPGTPPSDTSTYPQRDVPRNRNPLQLTTAVTSPANGNERESVYAPPPLRSQPKTLRLWIKAWEDTDHDLNGESLVWVQIDAGRWLVEHVQRQDRQDFAPVRAPRPSPSAKTTRPEPAKDAPAADESSGAGSPITSALKALQAQGNGGPSN